MDPRFSQLTQALQQHPGRQLNLPGLELRDSAVLAPFIVRGSEPRLLFTLRPAHLRRHAGQVSFPGGVRDPEDPTPLHTALREMREELGVSPEAVEVLGMLDEIPTTSEFRVVPYVGLLNPSVELHPDAGEIAEVLELPVSDLLVPGLRRTEKRFYRGAERDVYFYDVGRHTIWGATARILSNLLSVISGLPAWGAARPA
ncbi:MAG: CoA pyrophosphatase [Myxococcaceae bacterium]|nr:MAG: CoA pyrophosphatase [Myxococcaceae bacterium]